MRRIFCAIFVCVFIMPVVAHSSETQYEGDDCFYYKPSDTLFNKRHFLFCGNNNATKCGDYKKSDYNPIVHYLSDGLFEDGNWRPNGTTTHFAFYCCTKGEKPKLLVNKKEGTAPDSFSNSTIEKTVNGGTCQQTLDPCGNVISDCFAPDNCLSGYSSVMEDGRLKYCVKLCPAGQGVSELDVNTCVNCPTGVRQGVNSDGICVYCKDTQVFNPKQGNGECVDKLDNGIKRYSRDDVKRCWKCPSDSSVLTRCFNDWQGNGESGHKTADKEACGISD